MDQARRMSVRIHRAYGEDDYPEGAKAWQRVFSDPATASLMGPSRLGVTPSDGGTALLAAHFGGMPALQAFQALQPERLSGKSRLTVEDLRFGSAAPAFDYKRYTGQMGTAIPGIMSEMGRTAATGNFSDWMQSKREGLGWFQGAIDKLAPMMNAANVSGDKDAIRRLSGEMAGLSASISSLALSTNPEAAPRDKWSMNLLETMSYVQQRTGKTFSQMAKSMGRDVRGLGYDDPVLSGGHGDNQRRVLGRLFGGYMDEVGHIEKKFQDEMSNEYLTTDEREELRAKYGVAANAYRRRAADVYQLLSKGWMERLTEQMWGVPGRAVGVMKGFNFAGASASLNKMGIRNNFFGGRALAPGVSLAGESDVSTGGGGAIGEALGGGGINITVPVNINVDKAELSEAMASELTKNIDATARDTVKRSRSAWS